MTQRKTVRVFTKSVDDATREVEQIVSVFENVDLGKDVVKTGSFAGSLARWNASGDPIPVIWSHMWDDPFAHIGGALEAKELPAGDPLLPPEIADLGGLYVKYRVDEGEPFAEKVFQLLRTRRVREASFAYDVIREKKQVDGTTDLLELDLIEVGPTLKGMNPMTQLLSAKSLTDALVDAGIDAKTAEDAAKKATEKAAGDAIDTLAPDGTKAVVMLAGSVEETLDAYYRAATDYCATESLGLGGFYALHPEGTFLADQRAVMLVEGWDDPYGEGAYFEFTYGTDPDGDLIVESATAVDVEGVVVPKSRRKAAPQRIGATYASSAKAIERDTVEDEDDPSRSKGKTAEDPHQGKAAEDPSTEERSAQTGEPARALLEVDLLDLS